MYIDYPPENNSRAKRPTVFPASRCPWLIAGLFDQHLQKRFVRLACGFYLAGIHLARVGIRRRDCIDIARDVAPVFRLHLERSDGKLGFHCAVKDDVQHGISAVIGRFDACLDVSAANISAYKVSEIGFAVEFERLALDFDRVLFHKFPPD